GALQPAPRPRGCCAAACCCAHACAGRRHYAQFRGCRPAWCRAGSGALYGAQLCGRPARQGQLTLVSEAPVDADTAYSMLLGALRMQGFAVTNVGGVSRVVPEADAK